MIIRRTEVFANAYEALPEDIKKRAQKVLRFLLADFRHPSLNIKKLQSVDNIWYGRIDQKYRFTFQKEENILIMRRIGYHDEVIKNP